MKLADFGLAREESVTEMMTAETGTYRWMAPEVFFFDLFVNEAEHITIIPLSFSKIFYVCMPVCLINKIYHLLLHRYSWNCTDNMYIYNIAIRKIKVLVPVIDISLLLLRILEVVRILCIFKVTRLSLFLRSTVPYLQRKV